MRIEDLIEWAIGLALAFLLIGMSLPFLAVGIKICIDVFMGNA